LGAQLSNYGLKYDDIRNEADTDVEAAMAVCIPIRPSPLPKFLRCTLLIAPFVSSHSPNARALSAALQPTFTHFSPQRLSPAELSERNKRMKRAIDLSLKHTYLTDQVQKVEGTPYASYLEIDEVSPTLHSSADALFLKFHDPLSVLPSFSSRCRCAGTSRSARITSSCLFCARCKNTHIPHCSLVLLPASALHALHASHQRRVVLLGASLG
jgi:hypothetical protein